MKHHTIKLPYDTSIKPVAEPPRRVPYHLKSRVEETIADMVNQNVIEELPAGQQTPWISNIVIAPKDDGNIRVIGVQIFKMAEASFTVDYIMSLKVDALKDELEKRNLSKTGNKIDMQERLKEWLTLNARNTNISGVSTSDDFFDDYTEFKKFITESLAELKQSFEGLKQGKSSSQYLSEKNQGELIEIINGKDEMIKSLKEEIHFLRDRNFHNTQTFDTYALKETISLLKNELDQKQLIIERLISKESCKLNFHLMF